MTKAHSRHPGAGAVALAALLFMGAASSAAAGLLPHRALYHLELAASEPSIGLVEVDGAMVMEWRDACDGFTTRQRLGFVATTDDGGRFTYDVRFSSFESRDNTRLRFAVRSFDDGRLVEEFQGEAVLDGPGDAGIARFTVPEAQAIPLPAGTLFPTAHMRRILDSARAGERLVSHAVFDGSGLEGLSHVTAIIGRPQADESKHPPRRWPVSMAYHSLSEPKDLPEFELMVELGEDGVLREAVLDYGEFKLRAVLDRLEALAPSNC